MLKTRRSTPRQQKSKKPSSSTPSKRQSTHQKNTKNNNNLPHTINSIQSRSVTTTSTQRNQDVSSASPQLTSKSQQTSSTTPSSTQSRIKSLRQPLSLHQRATQWLKQLNTTTFPAGYKHGHPVDYDANVAAVVSTCLEEHGTDAPWDHVEQSLFAHPGAVFFLNDPINHNKYNYTRLDTNDPDTVDDVIALRERNNQKNDNNDVDKNDRSIKGAKSVYNKSYNLVLQGINGMKIDLPPYKTHGYTNHAVLGGKIIWGEPISIHNTDLVAHNIVESQLQSKFKRKKNRHQIQKVDNGQNGTGMGQNDDYLFVKSATAISDAANAKLLAFREEYHGFFPPTTTPHKPSLLDAVEYNNIINEINNELTENNEQKKLLKKKNNDVDVEGGDEKNDENIDTEKSSSSSMTPFPLITTEDIEKIALQEQLSIPNHQVEEIRVELNQVYVQLHNEMLGTKKPFVVDLPTKQQFSYLYNSLGNILKRRFKKSLQYDWKWTNQTLSIDSIDNFNTAMGNNHKLLNDIDFAKQQGFNSTLVSPHFFAFHLINYLGTISQDTAPAQPQLWQSFENYAVDQRKEVSKMVYANFKQRAKSELKALEQADINTYANLMETNQSEQADVHDTSEFLSDGDVKGGKIDKKVKLNQIDSTHDTSNTISSSDSKLKSLHDARMLTYRRNNAEFKELLQQSLKVQPWHTIYQQLSQFEYIQRRPYPIPQGPTTTTTVVEEEEDVVDDDEGGENNNGDGERKKTKKVQKLKTITTTQDIVFDVYAKVLTEHELLRRQTYHQNLRTKLLHAEKTHLQNLQSRRGLGSVLNSSSPSGSQSPLAMPLTPDEIDHDGTILMKDLVRSGDMLVKIWVEAKPIVTTTITSTTQWPKTKLPQIEELDDNDDLDIFNPAKQREREEKKLREKAQQIQRKIEMEQAQKALLQQQQQQQHLDKMSTTTSTTTSVTGNDGTTTTIASTNTIDGDDNFTANSLHTMNNNNDGITGDDDIDGLSGINTTGRISMDDEFQYPTTNFQVTNTPITLYNTKDDKNSNSDNDNNDGDEGELIMHHNNNSSNYNNHDNGAIIEPRSVNTPVSTEIIEQVHNTVEITKQQFQQGTVYFEAIATFSAPELNMCGWNKNDLDKLLIQMQSRM